MCTLYMLADREDIHHACQVYASFIKVGLTRTIHRRPKLLRGRAWSVNPCRFSKTYHYITTLWRHVDRPINRVLAVVTRSRMELHPRVPFLDGVAVQI